MNIKESTIALSNVVFKKGTATVEPTAVRELGDGKYEYELIRDWLDSEIGDWEIWTASVDRVSDESGNFVPAQKLADFDVAVPGYFEHHFILSWAGLLPEEPTTRTVRTSDVTLDALIGDSIVIDGVGGIQMPKAPVDGASLKVLDPHRKIKAGNNSITLGTDDRWLLADGSYDLTDLTFADNQLLGGQVEFVYSQPTKSWAAYTTYGTPPATGGTGDVTQAELDEAVADLTTKIEDFPRHHHSPT